MWNKALVDRVHSYPTGILTWVEPSGYPFSVRCSVRLDEPTETGIFTSLPPVAASVRGKACILFHHHDEHLEHLRQMVLKGELADGPDGATVFKVTEFVTANGRPDSDEMPHAGAPIHMMQFLLLVRRKAKEYMAKRGSPWPPIPFDEIKRKVAAMKLE